MFSKKIWFYRRQCLMTGWQIYAQRENFSPANYSNYSFSAIQFSAAEWILHFCDYRCKNSCSTRNCNDRTKTCTRNSRNVPKKIIKNQVRKGFPIDWGEGESERDYVAAQSKWKEALRIVSSSSPDEISNTRKKHTTKHKRKRKGGNSNKRWMFR